MMQRLVLLIAVACCFALQAQANYRIDSLKAVLERTSGVQRVDILNDISKQYLNQNTERALYYSKEALSYARELDDPMRLTQSLISLGVLQRNIGFTDQALGLLLEALQISESNGFKAQQADALHKIGVAYLLVKDYENALRYANMEIELWEQLKDLAGLTSALNFKGLIFVNTRKYEQAMLFLEEAAEIAERINNLNMLYKPLVNLGDLYMEIGDMEKALVYLQRSLDISEQEGNKFGIAVGTLKLGVAQGRVGEFNAAERRLRKALMMAEDINSLSLVRNCYQELALLYEEAKAFESALIYNRLYIATEDSMLSELTKREIAELELKYNIELKEREIEELQQQKEFTRFRYLSVGGALLLMFVLAMIGMNRYRLQKESEGKQAELDSQLSLVSRYRDDFERMQLQAARMQTSLLPANANFLNIFSQFFSVVEPKKVAGGDFLWYTLKGDQIIFVLADCHQHGVKGAFEAASCNAMIMQIIHENLYQTPADVLKKLHQRILAANQHVPPEQQVLQQGLDMAVLFVNIDSKRIIYAGAGLMLYLFYQKHLQLIPADPLRIGIGSDMNRKFHNKTLTLKKGDIALLMTDGLVLQQGKNGEAFGPNRVKNLLADLGTVPATELKATLVRQYEHWKGTEPQTDDLLVFGIEI